MYFYFKKGKHRYYVLYPVQQLYTIVLTINEYKNCSSYKRFKSYHLIFYKILQ